MVELIKAGQAIKSFQNGVDQALIPKRKGRPGFNENKGDRDQIINTRPV